ncbi:unnamed protein product [Nesidiocoris tenuis]|uniref:Uncharacterized protein n=1 Tax=Nesidiocoris tenuis TaxID=355587 RepID=A0A6H5HNG7_9HEMI|nr:unnamed protein product [Nesidiocoris tenuis]
MLPTVCRNVSQLGQMAKIVSASLVLKGAPRVAGTQLVRLMSEKARVETRRRLQSVEPPLQLSHPRQDVHRRIDADRFGLRSLQRRQLVRAGNLGHVRRFLCRPSRPEAHPDRLRLRGTSLPKGFPSHRLRRGILGGLSVREEKNESFLPFFSVQKEE